MPFDHDRYRCQHLWLRGQNTNQAKTRGEIQLKLNDRMEKDLEADTNSAPVLDPALAVVAGGCLGLVAGEYGARAFVVDEVDEVEQAGRTAIDRAASTMRTRWTERKANPSDHAEW